VITSALAGPNGLEGLALVRRGALEESELLAGGDGASGSTVSVHINVPAGFVAPPVGAGGLG
jgi:hypothetical protein